jgi:SH3 domain-containing YSC84-like protein 1
MIRIKAMTILGLAVVFFLTLTAGPAMGKDDFSKPEELVIRADATFKDFISDPNMGWFRSNLKTAKAIMIVPRIIKGGFIIGGSGGSGALLAFDAKTANWSNPAFYTMGSVSFGLQIGGAVDQVILLIMTRKGMDSYLSGSFKLGADVSVAAGPVGQGVGATGVLVDIYAFSRSKGAFGGLKIDGAVIAIRDEWNSSYYGKTVRPSDILILRNVDNPDADGLVGTLTAATRDKRDASPPVKTSMPPSAGQYHLVKSGDTLYGIATQNGISVDELCRLNSISKTDIIHPGQKLKTSP